MGGVNGDGDITDTEEGDPGNRLKAAAKSMAAASKLRSSAGISLALKDDLKRLD